MLLLPLWAGAAAAGNWTPPARATGPAPLDVTYYRIRLSVDPAHQRIGGRVTIALRTGTLVPDSATEAPDSLRLDLSDSMRVTAVRRDGRSVPFTHHGGILAVSAGTSGGTPEVLEVDYGGHPSGNGLTFARGPDGPRIASYGMPYAAREWWPSHDVPSDKADSADIEVTVPGGLVAVSNGRLAGRARGPAGTTTFHWTERHPIYPDVVSVAIAPYATFSLSHVEADGDTLPLRFYVFREDSAKAREDVSILPDVLAFYEELYGPYPFADEKYGLAEFTLPSFREHQTVPSLGAARITGTHRYDWILAHDLAHQWFGNSLTPASWKDVWLNESLAQYSWLLWLEHTRGRAAYDSAVDRLVSRDIPGSLVIADTTDIRSMFSERTFGKGPLVLDRLRQVVGDRAFFLSLRRYAAGFAYGTVTTRDFETVAERASGRSLDGFFREWVYGSGTPRDRGRPDAPPRRPLSPDPLPGDEVRREPAPYVAAACRDSARRQFDFWLGDWDVVNRQRRPRGTGWGVTGRATDRVHAVAGGCGIVEHWRGTTAMGQVLGYSLRAWNPARQKWDLVLLWPRPDRPRFSTLEGGFRDGRGEFFRTVADTAGNEVRVRFTFSAITPTSLRWSDGISRDGGRSWPSTWIMEFTRRDSAAAPLPNGPTRARDRCTFPETRQMDPWLGEWEGEAVLASGDTVPARASVYEILNGCGQVDRLQLGEGKDAVQVYRVRTYQPDPGRWVEYRLDSRDGVIDRLEGSVEGDTALIETPESARGPWTGRQVRTRWTRIARDGVQFETAVRSGKEGWTGEWTVRLRSRSAGPGLDSSLFFDRR